MLHNSVVKMANLMTTLTITVDKLEIMANIKRIAEENCWGCTSDDPLIQRYGSAHFTMGCLDDPEDIVRRCFQRAIFQAVKKSTEQLIEQDPEAIISDLLEIYKINQ